MENPYESPSSQAESPVEARGPNASPSLAKELGIAALLASFFGALVALCMLNLDGSPVLIFGAPAVGWFLTFVIYLEDTKVSRTSIGVAAFKALLLSIPAYLLYIPVCTVSSMLTTPLLGSNGHGPQNTGVLFGSVFAFLSILLMLACLIRLRRQSTPPSSPAPPEQH